VLAKGRARVSGARAGRSCLTHARPIASQQQLPHACNSASSKQQLAAPCTQKINRIKYNMIITVIITNATAAPEQGVHHPGRKVCAVGVEDAGMAQHQLPDVELRVARQWAAFGHG